MLPDRDQNRKGNLAQDQDSIQNLKFFFGGHERKTSRYPAKLKELGLKVAIFYLQNSQLSEYRSVLNYVIFIPNFINFFNPN